MEAWRNRMLLHNLMLQLCFSVRLHDWVTAHQNLRLLDRGRRAGTEVCRISPAGVSQGRLDPASERGLLSMWVCYTSADSCRYVEPCLKWEGLNERGSGRCMFVCACLYHSSGGCAGPGVESDGDDVWRRCVYMVDMNGSESRTHCDSEQLHQKLNEQSVFLCVPSCHHKWLLFNWIMT